MFRIALIISALLSGHHHTIIQKPNGAGYMQTSQVCIPGFGYGRIQCVENQLHIRARFVTATTSEGGAVFTVRRAEVFNAEGRLSGWVDWRPTGAAQGTTEAALIIGRFVK